MNRLTLRFYKWVILYLQMLAHKVITVPSEMEGYGNQILHDIEQQLEEPINLRDFKMPEKKHLFLIKHGAGNWLDIDANSGKKELFERIPGVREVFDGEGKRNEYTLFIDPRFDKQEIADTIELLLNLGL